MDEPAMEQKEPKTVMNKLAALSDSLDAIEAMLGQSLDAKGMPPHQPGLAHSIAECLDKLTTLDQQARRILGTLRECSETLG